ncbi:MAG: hypothetical protein AAB522_01160 [Patescibacteria group bacterium]
MLSWAQKRKFAVLFIFFALILGISAFFVLSFREPQKVKEPEAEKLSIIWSRFFETREGFVDIAALVENPNNFGAQKLIYSFKIYDKDNILITIKEGETFADALERFIIFEPNIKVNERMPERIIIDIKDAVFQTSFIDLRPKIDILGTEKFFEESFSRVLVNIKSREEKSLENIEATIVISAEDQNAIAISRTQIPFLGIGEERAIAFTWPKNLNGASSIEVFFR